MEQIFISDAAQAHFRKLLDTQEEGTNIRIFVVNQVHLEQNVACLIARQIQLKRLILK